MALYGDVSAMVYLRTSDDEEDLGRYSANSFSHAMLVPMPTLRARLAPQA